MTTLEILLLTTLTLIIYHAWALFHALTAQTRTWKYTLATPALNTIALTGIIIGITTTDTTLDDFTHNE